MMMEIKSFCYVHSKCHVHKMQMFESCCRSWRSRLCSMRIWYLLDSAVLRIMHAHVHHKLLLISMRMYNEPVHTQTPHPSTHDTCAHGLHAGSVAGGYTEDLVLAGPLGGSDGAISCEDEARGLPAACWLSASG